MAAFGVKYGSLDPEDKLKNEQTCCKNKKCIITVITLLSIIIVAGAIYALWELVLKDKSSDDPDELFWIKLISNDFSVEYYVKDFYQPRQMDVISNVNGSATIIYTISGDPEFIFGAPSNIFVLIDYESDSKNDKILKIFSTTEHTPTSIQYDSINNFLYITEYNKLHKCQFESNINEEILFASLSNNVTDEYLINDRCEIIFEHPYYYRHGHHLTKLHPVTNNLCMSFGVECDACEPAFFWRGTIGCFNDMNNPSLDNMTIYANGLRHCMGMDFNPLTNDLWFTDHNCDYMGDNQPDGELNKLSHIGQNFGFPYCHDLGTGNPYLRNFGESQLLIDWNLGDVVNNTCNETVFETSMQPLGPHVAPNGMLWYTKNMFDGVESNEQYTYQNKSIFIAQHGSKHRSERIGYRVAVVFLDDNETVIGHEIFADGWLNDVDQSIRGRPTELAILSDGSLLIADDGADAIYRVYYE